MKQQRFNALIEGTGAASGQKSKSVLVVYSGYKHKAIDSEFHYMGFVKHAGEWPNYEVYCPTNRNFYTYKVTSEIIEDESCKLTIM